MCSDHHRLLRLFYTCRNQHSVASISDKAVQWQYGLPDVIQEVPHLMDVLHRRSRAALLGCNTCLRDMIHSYTTVALLKDQRDLNALLRGYWPQLAVVVLRKQHFEPSLLQHHNTDLQLVAVVDLWEDISPCSVLAVASKAQEQQQAGMTYHSRSFIAAFSYLSERCLHVDTLVLRQRLGTQGIAQIMPINWCSLIDMDLRSNKLDAVDMVYVVNASLLQVTILDLSCNSLGLNGVEVLVSGNLPQLEDLDLSEAQLNASAARHLATGDWPNLEDLYLSGNRLDDMAMMHIADGNWTKLTELYVPGNPIGALGFQRLTNGRWPQLESLKVASTMISPASLALLDVHTMPSVHTLSENQSIDILRDLNNHAPGQPLVWPKLVHITAQS